MILTIITEILYNFPKNIDMIYKITFFLIFTVNDSATALQLWWQKIVANLRLKKQFSKDPECDCRWKYFKHYESKGCVPIYENDLDNDKSKCKCPKRFDCSLLDEVNAEDKGKNT